MTAEEHQTAYPLYHRAEQARLHLYMSGLITEAENERIKGRLRREFTEAYDSWRERLNTKPDPTP